MILNFNDVYNRANWINFLSQNFLPEDFDNIPEQVKTEFKAKYINKNVTYLGISKSLNLKVYEMHHKSENDPRIGLSRDAFKFIDHQKVKNALILFISENSDNYRFSLITREIKLDGKKVTTDFTNPKRFSYFIGPEAKTHTIEQYLVKKGKIKDEDDLKSRFSVEIVNKEFYNRIAEFFTELAGGVRKVGNKNKNFASLLKLPDTTDHSLMQEFAVRLIGRIVFCWFLKKKKSKNGIPLISEKVLSVKAVKHNYYHNILELLFFEVMNTPINERSELVKDNELFKNIPFLNGGLFDPTLHEDYYKYSDSQEKYQQSFNLKIPDEWFRKFFTVLELYNFTINENTSVDVDLSVDPEMLGRIFENLLAEINPETQQTARKSTGSFYTPRPIVEYMVDESLIQYLLTKTSKVDESKIRKLLDYTIEGNELTKKESLEVIDALDKIKIIDPACGSGAFPMGLLQKMLLIRQKVDPQSIEWVMRQLEKIPDLLVRKSFEDKLMNENWDYRYKMSAILHSIYGVDIQPIAVEISKLRFLLTLMVDETVNDEKKNRGINSLPNLSFKFVSANSLIGLPENKIEIDAFDFNSVLDPMIEKLEQIRERYFYASGNEKTEIENEFKKTQKDIGKFIAQKDSKNQKALALSNWHPFSDDSSDWFDIKWMFGVEDGFDIVIANPPYVRHEKIRKQKPLLQAQGYKVYNSTSDLYTYFYELSYNLLNENGISTFISSNKWMRAKYGFKLRKFFKENTLIKQIIDFGGYQVFDATVDTNIMMFQKSKTENNILSVYQIKEDFNKNQNLKEYFENHTLKMKQQDLDVNSFTFADEKVMNLKKKIERIGKPLKDWDVNIKRGITTGLNEAFIIDNETKEELCRKDPKNAEILKPILRGRDIKRYGYNFAGLYLLFIPWHFPLHKDSSVSGASKRAEIEFGKQYPYIYNHLLKYKEKLLMRNKSETGIRYEWYALQRCANTYYFEFAKDKIIYGQFQDSSEFSYCEPNIFLSSNEYMICGNYNRKYFLGILNSKLPHWFLSKIGNTLSENSNISQKSVFINLPIPHISKENKKPFIEIVDKILIDKKLGKDTQELENKIDLMVYKLYELTYEEVKIVDPDFLMSEEEYENE